MKRTKKTVRDENDRLRQSMKPDKHNRVMLTRAVAELSNNDLQSLLTLVSKFKSFNTRNDPYNEHNFGRVTLNSQEFFWKIDYYDQAFEYGANPLEGEVSRVLTIMRAKDY